MEGTRWPTIASILIVACCFNLSACVDETCHIPKHIWGTWFSRENGDNTLTEINADSMTGKGWCVSMREEFHTNYTFVFKEGGCYYCVKLVVRTINIMDKVESGCNSLGPGVPPTVDNVCSKLNPSQQLITLFQENFVPVNCRSSLEGVWQFGYQNRYRFTGECNNPEAMIQSCQTPGSQFLILNQKFNITYRACEGMTETFDGVVEYSCLGDWFVGKNHFFATANTKESRKEEKYRCFLKNRDDDLYIGASITAECNVLNTPENSPERMRITPVKAEVVTPGCNLPQNFSGDWINTANLDADVFINQTHIVETWYPDEGRYRRTIYVCQAQRDTRYLMARLGVDGCQKDYVCFEFVPRHHNVVRFRKGLAMIKNDWATVCSWVQFPNKQSWKYDIYLAKRPEAIRCPVAGFFQFVQKGEMSLETRLIGGVTLSPRPQLRCPDVISSLKNCALEQKIIEVQVNKCMSVDQLGRPIDIYTRDPVPVRCPVAGKFNFTQRGDVLFETRILGGVTQSPRPEVICLHNISDFSVCDTDQKVITIDENYCLSVDYRGRPIDIYSDPDYRMKCIGYWKENLKSYLITYDELDAFSKYRCWVYQRADLNRVIMSQSVGPFCNLNQDVGSWNYTEGAGVSLVMDEYERERDQCPMYFNDGENPWTVEEAHRRVFRFGDSGVSNSPAAWIAIVSIAVCLLAR